MKPLVRPLAFFTLLLLFMSIHPTETSSASPDWEDLRMASPSPPSITSWDAFRRDVFVRGFDGALYWKSWDGDTWSDWTSLGGNLTSAPDCVAPAAGVIYCVARGSFNWMMVKEGLFDHKGSMLWLDWMNVGGDLASAPSIASIIMPNNVIAFKAFARWSDGSLWGINHDGSNWGTWFKLPNSAFQGDPDCLYKGSGDVDCVLRSEKNTLLHNIGCCLNADGTSFEDLSGTLLSDPTIAAPNQEMLYVVARGIGDALWVIFRNDKGWSSWREIDANLALSDAPDCVSIAVGEADCVVLGPLGRVFYKRILINQF